MTWPARIGMGVAVLAALAVGQTIDAALPDDSDERSFVHAAGVGDRVHLVYGDVTVDAVRTAKTLASADLDRRPKCCATECHARQPQADKHWPVPNQEPCPPTSTLAASSTNPRAEPTATAYPLQPWWASPHTGGKLCQGVGEVLRRQDAFELFCTPRRCFGS
jgi:hypothetical protein